MVITYKSFTEKGLKRKKNQDRITTHTSENISLFAVADGMGGHSDGEYASQQIIEELEMLWNGLPNLNGDFQAMIDRVILSLENVNTKIFEYASSKNIICGSTVSILLIYGNLFAVINVGDSPVYYADRKSFVHASTEHSYGVIIQKTTLIESEEIDRDRKNRLIQAIGVRENVYPSVRTGAIKRKTLFLLCSDGVSKYFTEKQIKRCLKCASAKHLSELASYYKKNVYKKGADDNLSLIIVCVNCDNSVNYNIKLTLVIIAIAITLIAWIITNIIIRCGK